MSFRVPPRRVGVGRGICFCLALKWSIEVVRETHESRVTSHVSVITVFGSARPEPGTDAYGTARRLGELLARAGFSVATGGYGGTMEAVSHGAREAGGRVIGVTAEAFRSAANAWVEEEIRVKTWQERLFKLVELGAGYVVLPGGTGTLVELAVVWEWLNKGFLRVKPFVILGDFWLPVVNAIPASELHSNPILRATSPEEAVKLLRHYIGETPEKVEPRTEERKSKSS